MSAQVQQPIVVEPFDSLVVVDVDTNKPVDSCFEYGTEDHTHRTDEMSDDASTEEDHKHDDGDDRDSWNPPSLVDEQLSSIQQCPSSFSFNEEKEKTTSSTDGTSSAESPEERTPPPEQQSIVVVSSILKRSVSDPLHLKDSRRAWKCLPKPDISSLLLRTESEPIIERRRPSNKGGRVKFDKITVRSYSQTLGDNPSVSYGPPIQLDWDYEEHESIQLDVYEDARPQRRTLRQMVLSYYQRKNVLTWQYGYSEEVLKKAKKDAERAQMKRSITKALLPTMIVETAIESAKRKAKRLVGGGGSGSSGGVN